MGWTYDSFGNRKTQSASTGTLPIVTSTYNSQNQLSIPVTTPYDTAGDIIDDGTYQYKYDADNRVCAVYRYHTPMAMTGYLYDALGNRVAKGTISGFYCDPTGNGLLANPATMTNYVVGLNGEQLDEYDGTGTNLVHSNVFGDGKLLATLSSSTWKYAFNDWLGTKRAQITADGNLANLSTFQSFPFGDGLYMTGSDATEQHFTGKERDSESGNDYFFARYYSSAMGRFMSPDPSQLYYADQANPQSFNLYNYGQNNPLVNVDPTGLDCVYINNDTGAYMGFNRGDCDNSTTAKANSGYYFDGNATTLYTSDGTLQGQVTGIGGTGSDGNSLFDANPAGVSPSAPNQPVDVSTDLLNWASQQTIPTHGLWTYGNWAGSGGKGTPVDDVDTGAMKHDYCYHQGSFTAGSNYGGHSDALQACNQALCNAASKAEAKALAPITSAASKNQVPNDPGGHLMNEANAAANIIRYFSIVPFGNSCKGVNP